MIQVVVVHKVHILPNNEKSLEGSFWYREPPKEKTEEEAIEKTEVREEEEDKAVSLSPKEVLQTRVFWKIWVGQFAIALAQVDFYQVKLLTFGPNSL